MEVAALGLKVETQGVEGANKALDRLVGLADRAEKAVSGLEAAADSAGKKTRELDKGASGAAEATRELDKGASGAAVSTKDLDKGASDAAKSTGALDKGATGAAKATEALDKGAGKADKSTKGMGDSAGNATAQVDEMGKKAASTERGVSSFASAALKAGAILAAAFSVSSIASYADAWSDMQSKVGAATKDMEGAAGMMTRLVDIANASYSPLEQTVSTYSRNVTVLRELGKSSAQAADYVESLNNMLVLTATRGDRAASVQDALSKAMATGKLEADGLETVLANGGEVAAALARQLNTTTSGLRGLASQGKITGKVIADAMIGSLDDVRKRAAEMPSTISDAFVILTNNVTEFVGRIDKATGASSAISGVIIGFAGWLRKAGDYAIALGAVMAPVFDKIGSALSVVSEYAGYVGAALAGFVAPAVIGGITALATAIGVGLLGALKAVTAVMLANPLGLIVAGAAAAGYAVYKFRDDIKQAMGVDVVSIAKGAANAIIGSFAAAYEDVKLVWNNFGDILGAAVIGGVNLAIRAINSLIQGSVSGVNTLIDAINNIPGVDINRIGSSVGISEMANPYAQRLGASIAQRNAAVQAALSRDYVGDISGWLGGVGAASGGSGGAGGSGGGPGGNGAGKGGAAVAIEAETVAIKRALADQVSALEDAMERNEYLYGLGVRNTQDYYLRKAYLGREAGLAEAAAAEQEISVINKALSANKLTEEQRKKLLEDRRKLVAEVGASYIKAINAEISAEEAAARKRTSLQQNMTQSAESATAAAISQANALALQVEQYGMTETAIAKANVARAEEDLAIAQTTRAMAIMRGERAEDIELIDKEIAAIKLRTIALRSVAGSTAKLEILDKNKEFADEAKKQNEQIGESLTDALLRGFEDGKGFAKNFKDTLVNMFKTLVLKPIIQPVAQGAASFVTSALGFGGSSGSNANGSSSSVLGTANSLSSIYSSLTGSLTSSIANGVSAIGNAIGSSAVKSFATGMQGATLPAGMAGPTTAGASGAVGAGAAFGKVLPYIGWGLTAYSVLSSLFGNKSKPGVGNYGLADITSSGAVSATDDSLFFGDRRGFKGQSASLTQGLADLGNQIASAARVYGGDASGLRLYAQTAYSPDSKGSSGGTAIYGRDGQQVFGSSFSGTNEQMGELLSLTIQRSLLAGLKESNLAPQFVNVLNNAVDIGTATAEQLTAITQALENVRALNEAFDALAYTFPQLSQTTWDAREAIVAAAGGLEVFAEQLATYYQSYYTEQERANASLASMTATLNALGVETIPTTRAALRQLMESQDLTTASGQHLYAALLGMSEEFGNWADYAKSQAEATRELNAAFDQMAYTFPMLSQASGEARQSIANMAGGLSSLTSSLKSYQEGYYSDQERAESGLKTMAAAFRELGIDVMPESRAALRALIESQDLTTESGRKLYTALVGLSQGFGQVIDGAQASTNSLAIAGRDWARGIADNAMNVLVKAINSRKNELTEAFQKVADGLRTSISNLESSVGTLRSASTALTNTLRGMLGVIDPVMDRSRAQSLIRNAANGGALPSQADLEAALGIVATPAAQLFDSFEDYMLDFVRTANDIDRLNKLTNGQLSIEEQALATLKQSLLDEQERYDNEIKYLDKQIEIQQLALEEAMGNKVATLSVKDAVTEMSAAIVILGAKMAQVAQPAAVPGASLSSSEQAIYNAYKSSGLNTLDAEGWAFWNAAAKNGKPIDEIVADIIKINRQKGIDGSHANGLDYVPRDGYIAELHEGERVKTKAEARAEDMQRAHQGRPAGLMADKASLVVLQQILVRLGDMNAETRATAQNTGRVARLLDRWDGDGTPPIRDEME